MAAYAALASLMNLIDQIRHHPQPPVHLDNEQTQALTEKIAYLQDFLEAYNSHYSKQEVERLRNRIADAAYAAEDVIESHIVDQIHSQCRIYKGEDSLPDFSEEANGLQSPIAAHNEAMELYQDLHKLIENINYIKKDVEEIKDKLGTKEQLQRIITAPIVAPKSHSTQHTIMVGFDDVLKELLHKLTGQPDSHPQIIPISGMGGIGKTTLAKNLYTNSLIEHHFHVLAWVTISQEYIIKEILIEVLLCQKDQGSTESLSLMSETELGEKLYKSLCGRRYLIVMDDMWSNDVWYKIKLYFPRNNEGSRIIVTTRLSNVASYLSSGCTHEMDFLDQDQSWSLLCKTAFGEEDCPPELVDIGMEIAKNCRGLPLSIVVLGGLLGKSKPTQEYWAYILGNVSSIVNLEENERYLKILHTSYDELSAHLKACFLYMGIYSKDSKIRVSELINMWVAEGFLKPISGKSLEDSGEEYLMDLIDRNLILVGERRYSGKIKFCKIHDLLRDLCIREAEKEKFVFSANQHDHDGINTHRRIVIDENISKMEILQNLQSASVTRSLIGYSDEDFSLAKLRLLRVFKITSKSLLAISKLKESFRQVNLRYVDVEYVDVDYRYQNFTLTFPSLVSHLWNLQTLIMSKCGDDNVAIPAFWKMPLLRHVEGYYLLLPNPPSGDTDEFVLHKLHTLSTVVDLKFGEEVVKRIPNVKKLKLVYLEASDYCLKNLGHLYKLECLDVDLPYWCDSLQNVIFPHSLKKLVLRRIRLSWEDVSTKIGSLPHLQVLKMLAFFTTSEWKTMQGQFCSLKYLSIGMYEGNLESWTTESAHFPLLEHLALDGFHSLKEIPSEIGDIPTLKSIRLRDCSYSAIISAKQIAEEQEELGNEDLRVTMIEYGNFPSVKGLASHNFHVRSL